ncbi:MAG: hypothetical protein L0H31_10255 [Nocardioidaceae bacterium]|nr:hypothetical protein [Nocardioidaceae bacterium]
MNVVTTIAAVGPWGGRPPPRREPGRDISRKLRRELATVENRIVGLEKRLVSTEQMMDLQRRVDGLGARVVASSERTRVEVLDALAAERPGPRERM